MHDVFTFSFPWEFFYMKYIKLITLISPGGIHSTMSEHGADKINLRKRDCPELNISLDNRCCIYVNTGHCLKCFRRQVCVYRAYCTYGYVCVRLCECSSSFVLRHEKDIHKTTITLSLASYILYGVKLQPNTHLNETADSETNRIKRMEAKSYFENCVASILGGEKRNSFSSGCQLTTSQTLKESEKERTDKTLMDKATQHCVQAFVSKETSWKGGKKEEKNIQYTV